MLRTFATFSILQRQRLKLSSVYSFWRRPPTSTRSWRLSGAQFNRMQPNGHGLEELDRSLGGGKMTPCLNHSPNVYLSASVIDLDSRYAIYRPAPTTSAIPVQVTGSGRESKTIMPNRVAATNCVY